MELSELAFACLLYARFTNYDDSYISFLQSTSHHPDLVDPEHRRALLIWLNQWGCRQFASEYHDLASSEILSWYNQFNSTLFDRDKNLLELTEAEIYSVTRAYEALSNKTASFRRRKGSTLRITVGPTGASKILFALRRNALLPWDAPIREYYGYDGSGTSYVRYLTHVKHVVEELASECGKKGIELDSLPELLDRPDSTVPKLIDEYHWVTITRGCSPPTREIFRNWVRWS